MEELNDLLVKWGLKKQNKKRKKKFSTRTKYLHKVVAYIGLFMALIGVAFLTSKKDGIDPNALTGTPNVVGSSDVNLVDAKWDREQQLLISQYFIGNTSDVDSVQDDASLANLTYKTFGGIPSTVEANPKTTTMKINDHYIVVVTRGLPEGFQLIRYQVKPEALNKSLGVGDAQVATVFLKENKLKKYRKLRVESKDIYKQDYNKFLLTSYERIVKKANKSIQKSQIKIKESEDLIAKLRAKQVGADDSDAQELNDQISDIEDKIDDSKANIRLQTKKVNQYQKRIDSVKTDLAF